MPSKFVAHETQDSNDERFGSLGLFSEIWSIAWSPCATFIATASEDQTIRIWDSKTYDLVKVLEKHIMAVTGVRWENIQEIEVNGTKVSEILISCSDDQTLRVYDTKS